jgi:hypothetical protein
MDPGSPLRSDGMTVRGLRSGRDDNPESVIPDLIRDP